MTVKNEAKLPFWFAWVRWGIPLVSAIGSSLVVLSLLTGTMPLPHFLPDKLYLMLHTLPYLVASLSALKTAGLFMGLMSVTASVVGLGTMLGLQATILFKVQQQTLNSADDLFERLIDCQERCKQHEKHLNNFENRYVDVLGRLKVTTYFMLASGLKLEDYEKHKSDQDEALGHCSLLESARVKPYRLPSPCKS